MALGNHLSLLTSLQFVHNRQNAPLTGGTTAMQHRRGNVLIKLTAAAENDILGLTDAERTRVPRAMLRAVGGAVESATSSLESGEHRTTAVVDGLRFFMAISQACAHIHGVDSAVLESPVWAFRHAIALPFLVRSVPVSLTGAACRDIEAYTSTDMARLKEALPLAVRRVLEWLPSRSDTDGYLVRTVAYGFSFFMFASWARVRIIEIRKSTSPDSISGPIPAYFDTEFGTFSIILSGELSSDRARLIHSFGETQRPMRTVWSEATRRERSSRFGNVRFYIDPVRRTPKYRPVVDDEEKNSV